MQLIILHSVVSEILIQKSTSSLKTWYTFLVPPGKGSQPPGVLDVKYV